MVKKKKIPCVDLKRFFKAAAGVVQRYAREQIFFIIVLSFLKMSSDFWKHDGKEIISGYR